MAVLSLRQRRSADFLSEGPNVNEGMVTGTAQVYITCVPGGYQLYRSPDGRKRQLLPGIHKTPRAALRVRKQEGRPMRLAVA